MKRCEKHGEPEPERNPFCEGCFKAAMANQTESLNRMEREA